MRVLVTGGTGFIGSHSVAGLVGAGHSVRLLVRDPGRVAPALAPLGVDVDKVEVVTGDMTDAESVAAAVSGCASVLNAASVYSFDSRDHARMRRVNAAGTRIVLDAAVAAKLDPIVHVSTFAALVPSQDTVLSPDSPVGRPRETYMASKAQADQIARDWQTDGAPVVITYPGATLGPHDPHVGDQVGRVRSVLRGLMPMWPLGGFPIGDVRDVARLHTAIMAPGHGPRRLIAPSRYVSTREYVRTVRAVTGRWLPTIFLPAAAMVPVGWLTGLVQRITPVHIPAEYGAIYTCHTGKPVDTSRTDALLGGGADYDLTRTMADTIGWLHTQGLISSRMAGKAA
jgi:nucleoside-diphosphate-sugar epimerase